MRDGYEADAILGAATLKQIVAGAARFAARQGLALYGYTERRALPASAGDDGFRDFGNWSEPWRTRLGMARYRDPANAALEAEDPRVQHARAGLPALAWTGAGELSYTRADIGRRARALLRRARDSHVRGGIAVPLHAPGTDWAVMTFSTSHHCTLDDLRPMIAPSLYFASCLQVALRRVEGRTDTPPALTPREREVLHWVAAGKTSWEIARILAISERTVNFHVTSAAARLGVKGRNAASARALALGLIAL